MTKNPILNALAALLYIIVIASVMFYTTEHKFLNNSILAPIVVLSLFTLSAAVMGYVFFYQPVLLFMDGKKKQAMNLFIQTLGIFAGITAIILILVLSGILG